MKNVMMRMCMNGMKMETIGLIVNRQKGCRFNKYFVMDQFCDSRGGNESYNKERKIRFPAGVICAIATTQERVKYPTRSRSIRTCESVRNSLSLRKT